MTFKNHLVIVFFVFTAITGIISLRDAIPTKRLHVNVARVNSIINPVVSEFIIESIDRSLLEKAECLIIQLDTPGGLDLSMRDIVKAILNSDIPIIVYVAPSGARAASAGVMITDRKSVV